MKKLPIRLGSEHILQDSNGPLQSIAPFSLNQEHFEFLGGCPLSQLWLISLVNSVLRK